MTTPSPGLRPRLVRTLRSIYRRYQRALNPSQHEVRRFIRSHAPGHHATLCIDIGAGTVPYRRDLERAYGISTYVAIDTHPSDQTMVIADCCALPFPDASVDLVVLFDVVTCIADYRRALDEAARVTMPGGLIIITYTFLFGESGVDDYRRWTTQGMDQDLATAGFRTLSHWKRGGLFFFSTKVCENIILNCLPGNRNKWRAGESSIDIIRMSITSLLLLPFQLLGWLALLVDRILPSSPIYFGGAALARREPVDRHQS